MSDRDATDVSGMIHLMTFLIGRSVMLNVCKFEGKVSVGKFKSQPKE